MLSRNTPVAFIVGSAGFIGSHLSDKLLDHGVQVVGVDDFSSGKSENLTECVKDKNFHLIRGSITENLELKFPRLDYAFFLVDSSIPQSVYLEAFNNFLEICRNKPESGQEFKTKIVLISSVELYDGRRVERMSNLKQAEERLAHFSQENKANARVVRLSTLFGPRMNFKADDPVCRLIKSAVLDELQNEATPLDFTTRSLFVEDAVDLLIRAVMHGATAQKIYDGVRVHPIKITEIKQVLLDPLWHERKGFVPTELPPWPTPNITKTMRELSWKPKTSIVTALKDTVAYFRKYDQSHFRENLKAIEQETENRKQETVRVEEKEAVAEAPAKPKQEEKAHEANPKDWGAKWREIREAGTGISSDALNYTGQDLKKVSRAFRRYTIFWAVVILVVMAFFYPAASVVIDAVSIRDHLTASSKAVTKGDFKVAEREARVAKSRAGSIKQTVESVAFLKFARVFDAYLNKAGQLADLGVEVTEAADHSAKGAEALSSGIKVVSGEMEGESGNLFETAGFELDQADRQLALALSRLSDDGQLKEFKANMGDFLNNSRLDVDRSRAAVSFLTQAIPSEGKKSYLVLLQDNGTLRPSGGVIVAYAEIIFESGKLLEIKTDSIANFEAQTKDTVEPPAEIKNDLAKDVWSLRDYGFNADFPANAKLAQWFYRRSAQALPAGVIALDFTAAAKFPGSGTLSDSGAEDLSKGLKDVVNQVFFLSKQNWIDTGQALNEAVREKHLMVYMSDPLFFSFLSAKGWAGTIPEEEKGKVGEREQFLALFEANLGNNGLNKTLERSFKLESNIDKAGWVSHKLNITYSNQESTLPGTYKSRLKMYLPAGSKLTKAKWGSSEITKDVKSFSDYGRAGYSMVLELKPREEKELVLEFQDGKSLSWEADQAKYRLQVIKQPGTLADKFDFKLNFPSSWRTEDDSTQAGEQIFSADLSQDRSFEVTLKK